MQRFSTFHIYNKPDPAASMLIRRIIQPLFLKIRDFLHHNFNRIGVLSYCIPSAGLNCVNIYRVSQAVSVCSCTLCVQFLMRVCRCYRRNYSNRLPDTLKACDGGLFLIFLGYFGFFLTILSGYFCIKIQSCHQIPAILIPKRQKVSFLMIFFTFWRSLLASTNYPIAFCHVPQF